MKNILCFFIGMLALTACRTDEISDLQNIDQVIQIYMRNSDGKDLLNTNLKNTYTFSGAYDLGGEYDKIKISQISAPKIDKDTMRYIEYISGAKRVLRDSVSPELKQYQSILAFEFTQKINDSVSQSVLDTMRVNYKWTPQLFEVSHIYWNNKKVFIKTEGQPNTIVIVK